MPRDWSLAEKFAAVGAKFTLGNYHDEGAEFSIVSAYGAGASHDGFSLDEVKANMNGDPMAFIGVKGGCQLNEKGFLLPIDADAPGDFDALMEKLPELKTTLQQKGSKLGHFFVSTDVQVKSQKIKASADPESKPTTELLGLGAQCLIKPSDNRRTKKSYEPLNNNPIIHIPWARLKEKLTEFVKEKGYYWKEITIHDEQVFEKDAVNEKIRDELTLLSLGLKPGKQSCQLPGHAHGDTDPSLSISDDGKLFNCFSKHGGGDIFKWYMLKYGFTFPEAKARLIQLLTPDTQKEILALQTTDIQTDPRGRVYIKIVSENLVTNKQDVKEQYLVNSHGIYWEKMTWKSVVVKDNEGKPVKNENGEIEKQAERLAERNQLIKGNFKVIAKVIYQESENKANNWVATIDGSSMTGTFDEIITELKGKGRVTGKVDELKAAFAKIISENTIEVKKIYTAPGIYWNTDTGKCDIAVTEDKLFPKLDTQLTVLTNYKYVMDKVEDTPENRKLVVAATAEFVRCMPKVNVIPALITRGYCCAAPLAYEFKKSILNIFPYLYLYGDKGSSKTQMASYSATIPYGELQFLNSEAIDSSFRLAMEFAASKFPRVVDEAQESFVKNLSIFKSAATSTMATKRGNKDKSLDTYAAYCTFVFTSNNPPIRTEEDAQGAMADRLLVVGCGRGSDFLKDEYVTCTRTLSKKGQLFGKIVLELLQEKLTKDGGMDVWVDAVRDISRQIQEKHPAVHARRAYCLAEMITGVKMYHYILAKYGVPLPVAFKDESDMIDKLVGKMIQEMEDNDGAFIEDFQNWAFSMARKNDGRDANQNGVYQTTDGQRWVITANALKTYRKFMSIKSMAITDLGGLAREYLRNGFNAQVTTTRVNGLDKPVRGIVVNEADLANGKIEGYVVKRDLAKWVGKDLNIYGPYKEKTVIKVGEIPADELAWMKSVGIVE